MDTSDCVPVEFLIPHDDAFYFAEHDTDLDQDSFMRSRVCLMGYCIRNNDNKFVILNTDEQFQAQNLSWAQQRQNGSKFDIQFYNDNQDGTGVSGKPVILYTKKDDRIWAVSCNEKGEIHPEKMDQLPSDIPQNEHKAVFYRREVSSNKYWLRSSMYSSKYLGFQSCATNGSPVLKLVLITWTEEEVDGRIDIRMSPSKN